MKLRINAKLRAALIAAISTVGFTLTQAQAATLYTQPNFNDGSASGQEYIWVTDHWELNGERADSIGRPGGKGGVMVIDNAGTVSNPVGVADTSDAGGVKVMGNTTFTTSLGSWAGSIFVEAAAVLNASYGASLKNTEAATAANVYVDGTLNITGRSDLNLNDGKNYQNWYIGEEGFINLSGITSVSKGSRAWNIQLGVDEGEPVSLDGYTNRTLGGQITKKFMSTGADLYGQVASFAVFCDGVEMDSSKYTINHNASGMSVTFDAATAINKMSLTWGGGEAAWEVKGTNWTDAAGTTTSFANGDDVTFTGSGNKANVVGAIETGAITVNGGTTIDTTADGASLAADSLTMGAGGSLTLAGTAAIGGDITVNGAATIDATADGASLSAGSLTIGAGSSLAFAGTAAIAGAVSVADANALVIGTDSTLKVTSDTAKALIQGTQVANSGTLAATGGMSFNSSATTQMGGTLAIAAGQKLTIGTNKDNQSYNFTSLDALVLGQGANIDTKALKVDIKNLTANGSTIKMLDTKDKNQVGVDLKGTTTLDGNLTITSDWKYKVNIEKLAGTGNLILTGGWEEHRAVIGDADINSISVKSAMTETWLNGTVKLSDTLDLNGGTTYAGENGSLTVGGLTGTTALAAANGITFTGASEYTYTGTLTTGGQIVKQGTGSQTIGNASLVRALDVQAGTLALTGTYAIDHITDGVLTDKYFDYEGTEGNNGFYLQSGSITVYTVAGEGASINVEGAHFTYGEQDVTSAVVDDGAYDIPVGDPNYTTYHLNDVGASVDLAAAYTYSREALTTVNVNGATGTLTTDSAVSLATLNVASGSTATVDGAGTVSVTTLSNSGTLNVAGSLTMASALALPVTDTPAIQVLSGGVLTLSTASTIGGQGLVNGTDSEQGNSAAFSNLFQGKAVSVADGGLLVMHGNIITTDHGGGEMDMALSSLKVEGKLTVNTWSAANYKLNGHSLEVTDNLWLKNHQDVTVGNGSLTVGGQLQISHEGNDAGGRYKVAITAGAGNVTLGSIGLYGGGNTMSLDGTTLTFTSDAGNVINKLGSAGNDNTVITLANTKLVADASSWTLAPITGVTVAMTGANTIDVAAEKTITLTVSSLNGAITKTGEGSLVFTSASEGTLTDSIKVQQGALTLSGTYVIDNITAGSVVVKYVDTTGAENPNGGFYQQSGTKTVYTVAEGIASINVAGAHFTYGGKDVTASVQGGSFELPAEPIKTTLWVNAGELAYDDYYAASDGALTTAKVAGNATLTVGTNAVGTLEYQTNGTTITLAGTGTVNAISGTGILNMAAGAHVAVPSLTVSSAKGVYSTGTGTLALDAVTISGSGSIEFDSNTEIGTTHLTGGSITFGGTGTTHKLTDLGLSQEGGSASTVNVKAGTTVHIVGTTVAKDRDSRFMGSFSLSHWSADNTVNVYGTLISDVVVSSCDGRGIINVESGGRLEMRDGLNRGNYNDNAITFNVKSGAILAAGTTHNTTETKNSNNVVVNLEGGSTFEAYYGAQDTTAVINKVLTFGEGTITMNAGAEGKTLQLNSNITGEGVTISKKGEGTLALNGNANVLYNTIDLQAGTLALNGSFDVSHISHSTGTIEYYADPAGSATTNGFAKYTGEVQLVNANYANVTVGDNAVITLDGYSVDYSKETGKAGGTVSLAAFYINEGAETLSAIQQKSPNAAVTLADGAKLVADADLSVLTVTSGKGYVEIGQNATVQAATGAVELSGSGTYVLGSGASSLGSATLGGTWTGAVKVTKNDLANLDLNTFGQAGSIVEIDGWSKHLNNTDAAVPYTYDPKLRLGTNGLTIADGYSGRTYIFAGGVEGTGNFKYNIGTTASNQTYAFTGDVSKWTGAYQSLKDGKTSTLKFYGNATEVNAAIEQTAGAITLVVGNGEDEFSTEFKKAVTASAITVNANASATFNELHITSAIANSGTVTFKDNLVVTNFTEQAGAAGYYDLEGVFTTDGNGYVGNDDSYITVVDGGSVVGNITVTQGETTYNLLNSGNATLAGSGEDTIDYTTFRVVNGSVNISDITGAGHGTSAIQVSNNGILVVNVQTQGISIDVTGTGTISGQAVNPTEVGIEQQATAKFDQPVEEAGVKFTAAEGETVNITNMGTSKDSYSTENKEMNVQAQTLEMTADADVTVSNTLWGLKEVVNETGHVLTLDNAVDLELKSMTIGEGSKVAVYTDETAAIEGTVTITDALTAGGGKLYANLTLEGHEGEQLLYWDLNGAGENALTLGSVLTLNTETGLIQLDDETMQQIAALGDTGEYLELVLNGGEPGTLGYDGDAWFDGVFSRSYINADGVESTLGGDYNVQLLENGNFGIVKFSNVPEPTTGTLSLLALAALAARRRKH